MYVSAPADTPLSTAGQKINYLGFLVSRFSIEKKVVAIEIVGICTPIAATQILHLIYKSQLAHSQKSCLTFRHLVNHSLWYDICISHIFFHLFRTIFISIRLTLHFILQLAPNFFLSVTRDVLPSWLPRLLTHERFPPQPTSNYALAGRHMFLVENRLCGDIYSRILFSLFLFYFCSSFTRVLHQLN